MCWGGGGDGGVWGDSCANCIWCQCYMRHCHLLGIRAHATSSIHGGGALCSKELPKVLRHLNIIYYDYKKSISISCMCLKKSFKMLIL